MTDVAEVALDPGAPPHGRVRRWAFRIVLAAALLLIAAPMAPFLVIPVAWPFLVEDLGVCLVHDVGVAVLLWWLIAGLLAQARDAGRQVGAMQQVLLVILAMVGLMALTRPATLLSPMLLFFGLVFVGAALHPARAELARMRQGADRYVAALGLIIAGPLLGYAVGQLRLDGSALTPATHGGHWTTMATVAVLIFVLALLAATRPCGWRVPAWSAGVAALLFGIASASQPDVPSSIGPAWGALTAVWAVVFVLVAEWRFRRQGAGTSLP
jgi:hypothetical protein